MQSTELTEQIGICPLEITLSGKTGYTLWASRSGEATDILIAIEKNIILFKNVPTLYRFISSGITTNFSHLKGFKELGKMISNNTLGDSLYASYGYYNFDTLVKLLSSKNWAEWSSKKRSKVLNHLNLMWDIGETIQNLWIVEQMRKKALLGSFADILFLGDSNEFVEIEKSSEEIISLYKRCLLEAEARIFLIAK